MGAKRMVDLDVYETSGVDHPAHLHEGFAVMKAHNPEKAGALLRALGKEPRMTQQKATAPAAPSAQKSLADILAAGDGALAAIKADDVAKAIDSKAQAILDSLATAWQDLRTYAESQDDTTPTAGGGAAAPEVDPTLAAAAEAAGLDPALAKSADPAVQALLKSVTDQVQKANEKAAEAEKVAKAERDARLDADAIQKSRGEFKHLTLQHDSVAPALRRLAETMPDVHKAVTEALIGAEAQVEGAGALTKALGTPGHTGTGNSVWDQIDSMAKAKVEADPTLTIQKARAQVFEENPAMQAAYQKEASAR